MGQIILENISKSYDGKHILNQLNHIFEQGQSIAFWGHNGCGKSTLLKIIAGLITPTTGKIIYNKPLRFSYVPEKFMPQVITGRSFLWSMGKVEGIEDKKLQDTISSLTDEFYVSEMLDIPMRSLSKGTLQKISVISALLNIPDVLLLDEPISGQDVHSQRVLIKKVNDLREQGVTVLMSCHEQQLIDAVSDQVFTIQEGNLVPFQRNSERNFTLILENTDRGRVEPGMKRYGTGYQIQVTEKQVQPVILQLFSKGWELKGMYANDVEFNKI